jgi:hypothetical protein
MRILVCPLDWGLGHAARCIPLIRALGAAGHEVRIAAAGGALGLLRGEFPELPWSEFPGYRVRYARSAWLFLPALLAQAPALWLGFRAEARRLRRLLAEHPCDLVVSDGRYGVRAAELPTIFITHQIAFRAPRGLPGGRRGERILLALNLRALARFDRVWIPDWPGEKSLAGGLAGPREPAGKREWIGPLGRFAPSPKRGETGLPRIDIAAVVSGPEPQRSLFESALRRALAGLPGTRVLARGLPGRSAAGLGSLRAGEVNVFDHLPGGELARLFTDADVVVARSGYTTVMELAGLGARAAVLVPTPGQTEQEHLAAHLAALGAAVSREQDALDLASAIAAARLLPGFRRWRDADGAERLRRWVAAHPLLQNGAGAAVGKPGQQ